MLACLLGPAVALAQSEIPAEIFMILAADSPGTIDARLSGMPGLRQPPFDGYGSMSLLELRAASLGVGAPYDVTLPNGRVLRIAVEGVTDEGRYRVRVVINRPGETDYLPLLTMLASPGLPFFVAGQRMDAGALIIAIRLGAASGSGAATDPGASLHPPARTDGRLSTAPRKFVTTSTPGHPARPRCSSVTGPGLLPPRALPSGRRGADLVTNSRYAALSVAPELPCELCCAKVAG